MRWGYLTVGAVLTAGCAGTPQDREPVATAAVGSQEGLLASAESAATPGDVLTVDIADFRFKTVCKDVTVPGTHLIRERRCYTPDAQSTPSRNQVVQSQLDDLRRDKEIRDRMYGVAISGGRRDAGATGGTGR